MKMVFVLITLFSFFITANASAENAAGLQATNTDDGPMVGAYYTYTRQDGFGFYADLSSNFDGGSGEDYDIGTNVFNDPEQGTASEEFAFHIGATKAISEKFYGYAGVGIYERTQYLNLYDPLKILATDGFYNIQTDASTDLSLAAGVIYNGSEKIQLKAGFETGSGAMNVGIGYRF